MRMKPRYVRFGQFVVITALPVAGLLVAKSAAAVTTVACIGEQSTSSTDNFPVTECWPGQLGTLLGASYDVGNDVVTNGNTVTSGNCVTASSKAGPPNIVIIGPFAEHDYAAGIDEATWQADYLKVVEEYLALTPPPTVYVMTPPPAAFVYQSTAEQTFATTIVEPAVLAVAAAKDLHVIDLFHDALLGMASSQPANPPDGHFSLTGAAEVAKLAYEALTGTAGTDGGTGTSSGASSGTSSGASTGTAAGTGTTAGTGTATAGTTAATGTATTGTATTGTTEPTSGATAATGSSPSSTGGGGTAGTSTTPSSGTTVASAGSSNSSSGTEGEMSGTGTPKNSSSCTMGASGSKGAAAGLLSLFGLALLVGSRKRGARRG